MKKSTILPIAKTSLTLLLASSVVFSMVACQGTKATPKGGAPTANAEGGADKTKVETKPDAKPDGKPAEAKKMTAEEKVKQLKKWISVGLESLAKLESKTNTEDAKKTISPVVEQLKQLDQLLKDAKSVDEKIMTQLNSMSQAIEEVRKLAISVSTDKEAGSASLYVRIWTKYYLNKNLSSDVIAASKFNVAKLSVLALQYNIRLNLLVATTITDESAQKEFAELLESTNVLVENASGYSPDQEIQKSIESTLFQLESKNKIIVAMLEKSKNGGKENATKLQEEYIALNLMAGRDAKFVFGEVAGRPAPVAEAGKPAAEASAKAAAGTEATKPAAQVDQGAGDTTAAQK